MKMLVCLAFGVLAAWAQGGSAVVGTGYHAFAPIWVAPGHVITVFVTGVGNVTQPYSAGKLPLPTTLGGISATLNEFGNTPVPILAVAPVNACFNTALAPQPCGTTAVTVQIPFELHVNNPGSLAPPVIAFLTITDQMGHSATVELNPVPDQIHVLSVYDTVLGTGLGQTVTGGGIVTHADGTLVGPYTPALPGEELVMYAVGLGAVSSPVKTGDASPSPPVPINGRPVLNFNFQPNAQPTPATITPWSTPVRPLFVGLTPSFAGLYQINFVVPKPTSPVPPCAGALGFGADVFAAVGTNLTVTVIGWTSFDGAGICVAVGS